MARPITKNIKEQGKDYFKEYARKNNNFVSCECGCVVKKNYLITHKKSKKHFTLLDFKECQIINQ